jgi:hypothetical protein
MRNQMPNVFFAIQLGNLSTGAFQYFPLVIVDDFWE